MESSSTVAYEYGVALDGNTEPSPQFHITADVEEARAWAERWRSEGVEAHVVVREVRVEFLRGDWHRRD